MKEEDINRICKKASAQLLTYYEQEVFKYQSKEKGNPQPIIDFLIDENNMKLYFSKISTLPYHMASHIWKKNKVSESELLENMINIY